jgi:hypothetical protein
MAIDYTTVNALPYNSMNFCPDLNTMIKGKRN